MLGGLGSLDLFYVHSESIASKALSNALLVNGLSLQAAARVHAGTGVHIRAQAQQEEAFTCIYCVSDIYFFRID